MSDQQVLLRRQEAEQQEKVKASVPDENKLAQLEKQVKHLKKGTLHHTHTQHTRAAVFFSLFIVQCCCKEFDFIQCVVPCEFGHRRNSATTNDLLYVAFYSSN